MKTLLKENITFQKLEQAYNNAALPKYEIIDLKKIKLEKQSWISKGNNF